MIIQEIKFSLHRFAPTTPWQDATHRVSGLEFIVARLRTKSGATGIGLTYTVGVGGSAVLALLEDYCANVVIGCDIREVESIWQKLFNHLHRTGSGGINTLALAAIDTAVWDAWARAQEVPIWRALGGARESVQGYGSGIDLFMSVEELRRHIEGYLKAGYQAVKIKVGRQNIEEDVSRVRAARELIGDERLLLLDANQCWTVEEAIARARAFEPFAPAWLEEPLMPEDVAGHARLRAATAVPIAVGESLYTMPHFLDYLRAGAADVLQPDVARVGGFTPWRKIAALGETWQVKIAPHFLAELSLQALCGVPNGFILENVTGGSLAELGITKSPLVMRAGEFVASPEPGNGIVLDEAVLERHRVGAGDLRKLDTTTHL